MWPPSESGDGCTRDDDQGDTDFKNVADHRHITASAVGLNEGLILKLTESLVCRKDLQ